MASLGTSFGAAAGDYDRGRPTYPTAAVAWMLGDRPSRVLDLGAGTGKLTAAVVGLGHETVAVDPDPTMLATLHATVPGVPTFVGTAERIPLPDSSVDAVVLGQAWHWVDVERALAEAARVLRPGGVLGLIWNIRDERVAWIARLTAVMRGSAAEKLIADGGPTVGPPFGDLDARTDGWARPMTRDDIAAMVRSRSYYITGDADYRARVDADLQALLDEVWEPGAAAIDVPYVTHTYRARRP